MSKKHHLEVDSPKKNILSKFIFYIFSVIIFVILTLLIFTLVFTRQNGEPPVIFGHSLFIVTTSSMEDSIPAGSAIIVEKANTDTLKSNEIITFKEGYNENKDLIINTHRIVRSNPTDIGLSFITKGDNNNIEDSKLRYAEDIIGKVVFIAPSIGNLLIFIKSPIGLIVFIAIPLLLLLILEVLNLLRLSKAPKEKISSQKNRADLFGTNSGNPASPIIKKRIPIASVDMDSQDNITASNKFIKDIDVNLYNIPKSNVNIGSTTPIKNTNYVDNSISSNNDNENHIISHLITTAKDDEDENPKALHIITTVKDDEDYRIIGSEPIVTLQDEQNQLAANNKINPEEEFSASLQNFGKDKFCIDGIDVTVQPNSIRLGLNENSQNRDICITVTNEYTNVLVDGKVCEMNFALFKDEKNGEQKVIIQKKNK